MIKPMCIFERAEMMKELSPFKRPLPNDYLTFEFLYALLKRSIFVIVTD